MNRLDAEELTALIRRVFNPKAGDRHLAILVDVPDSAQDDTPDWKARRRMAAEWAAALNSVIGTTGLQTVNLFFYPNVHANNADMPETAYTFEDDCESLISSGIEEQGAAYSLSEILFDHQLILAPTQFSATAPLKLLAREYGFRAATLPGFSEAMIPALRLDYDTINQKVNRIKNLLDPAVGLNIRFDAAGENSDLHVDLRLRTAHASGGRFPDPGTAGNLPSGESYIVPYEGEKGEPSRTSGMLPVQFGDEIVRYRIENNKAIEVISQGLESEQEAAAIRAEPAYANIAEIGFGILKDFGIEPVGEILLDEKLGLHIAFGRSDHFGGAVGAKDFSAPDKVVHLDRIYIPEIMNRITVTFVDLIFENGKKKRIMEKGKYQI